MVSLCREGGQKTSADHQMKPVEGGGVKAKIEGKQVAGSCEEMSGKRRLGLGRWFSEHCLKRKEAKKCLTGGVGSIFEFDGLR